MASDRELMRQALDALDLVTDLTTHDDVLYEAIDALRARLAQPEPEPSADKRLKVKLGSWYGRDLTGHWFYLTPADDEASAALTAHTGVTAPPRKEWQGLTYKERCELWNIASKFSPDAVIMHDFARDIERALKEKNQ